jgi:MFS family permease
MTNEPGREPDHEPDRGRAGGVAAGASLGRPYWRLWTSSTLSNLADGLFQVALPLVAIQVTRSPALISGLTVALTLPWLLFALQAGALADRQDRRRLMLGANLVRALLLAGLVLLVLADAWTIWVVYLVALGIGLTETIYDTSAQSILPQIVARGQLSKANGRLFGAQLTANEFVGPPLGGALVATGAALSFAIPSALWLAAVGTLLLVRGRFRVARDEPTTMRADIAEGLRYLWRHRLLRTLAIMTGTFNFASNAVFAIFVLYAVGPDSAMGLSEPGYGLLLATVAAGSLVGSLAAERLERLTGRARALLLAFGLASGLALVPALTADVVAIGTAYFVGGFSVIVANVIMVSLRQLVTPDRLLGRVNSAFRLFGWGTRPVGALAGGLLAQVVGLRPVFAVMALVKLATLVGGRVVTDRAIAHAEAGADA